MYFLRFGKFSIGVASVRLYGALGRVPPLDFQLFNFFLVTSEPHKLWHWTFCGCLPKKNIQAYSFVSVYWMNFIIFLHVTLKLFSLSFVHNSSCQILATPLMVYALVLSGSRCPWLQMTLFNKIIHCGIQTGKRQTLKTMCMSSLSPSLPGYLPAMLVAVRSMRLAPVSAQIQWTNIFLPVPRGPANRTDRIRGPFTWTADEPGRQNAS